MRRRRAESQGILGAGLDSETTRWHKSIRMKRLLPILAALSITACQTTPQPGLTHVVVFWLKEPGNTKHRAQIIEVSESFRRIPGVLSVHTGPCIPSDRPIVDSSFDVAVSLTFASRADLQRYLDHPAHKAATVSTLKPIVKKITVYDFGG
jgi:hypothetical protein